MQTTAQLRFLRMSPRKVKLVIDLIRGRQLAQALTQLEHVPKAAARPVAKLLASAAANARERGEVKPADWYVSSIQVGQGPRLKRWMPRAQGRATPFVKPSCHIRVVLSDQAPRKVRSR